MNSILVIEYENGLDITITSNERKIIDTKDPIKS